MLIAVVFLGILLAATANQKRLYRHKNLLEKGAILAGLGAISMALANFLTGASSQTTSPLMTIWFIHAFLAVISLIVIAMEGNVLSIIHDFKKFKRIILLESILDNAAWIAYAIAMTLIPISIATAVSEGYIAVGVLLGYFVNKEKLRKHQIIGVILVVVGVLTLAIITA